MGERLAGKITIITGAGSGIGRASAERFAEEGASVIVNDIVAERAKETVDAINARGGRAVAYPADMTVPEEAEALIARATDEFGRLDVLFNNAGGAMPEPTDSMALGEYRRLIALNLDSAFYETQFALRVMMEQRSGCILMTTSGAGLRAVRNLAVYGMAKAGVISLARSIAADYGRYGIRANVISPGPMATPPFLAWLDTVRDGLRRFEAQVPIGRLGTPEDIAHTALFLSSDQAPFVNGVTIPVDGGVNAVFAAPQVDSAPAAEG
ncbi:MAG: SDR family oxidoreductase [Deltaproteobacteria bacterium]|jgi:NAD(P)-dependent dehydrogenase (short-subunit alcohol dehydrogenase family)|nr:SDR family oxidoreductase [Deltaproteobacteria bacterium]